MLWLMLAVQLHNPLPLHTVPQYNVPVAVVQRREDGIDPFRPFNKKRR